MKRKWLSEKSVIQEMEHKNPASYIEFKTAN